MSPEITAAVKPKRSVSKKSAAFMAVATALGVSGPLLFASSASAGPTPCGPDGTLLTGNICEQTFDTPGDATFTPTAQMSTLQVLLVGGGGSGMSGSDGYSGGGGGGAVVVHDFTGDTSTVLNLVVGDAGDASSAAEGAATPVTAAAGGDALGNGDNGTSGNGNEGYGSGPGAGGGAGGAAVVEYYGGGGAYVQNIAPAGSLFSSDENCYGGGGAYSDGAVFGDSTCGGGTIDGPTQTAQDPATNSGGGGAGVANTDPNTVTNLGAAGTVVVRWLPTVVLSLDVKGVTTTESVNYGTAPAVPPAPTSKGDVFKGWYTDPTFTTKANFSDPLTTATTFYALFVPALATTGVTLNPLAIPLGLGGLGLGVALLLIRRRRTQASAE